MNPRCVVVDANIAFKALAAGRGDLRDRLGPGASVEFFSPRFLFVELFKHKERLAKAAKVTEEEMVNALHTLVSRLEFVNEANIPLSRCLDGRLWTHDGELKTALRAKGFDRFFDP